MSAATPDHVLRAVWNNSKGIGEGAIVTREQYREYMLDLGGWFTYWGDYVEMQGKSVGAGLYRVTGKLKYQ